MTAFFWGTVSMWVAVLIMFALHFGLAQTLENRFSEAEEDRQSLRNLLNEFLAASDKSNGYLDLLCHEYESDAIVLAREGDNWYAAVKDKQTRFCKSPHEALSILIGGFSEENTDG